MVKKELKKKYTRCGMLTGAIVGLILTMIAIIIPFFFVMPLMAVGSVMFGLAAIPVSIIIGYLIGASKYKGVERRINILEQVSGSIDEDVFEHIGLEMSVGDRWLVYHNGLDNRFWTKSSIGKVERVSNNTISIEDLNTMKKSNVNVSTNLDLVDIINNWVQPYQMN